MIVKTDIKLTGKDVLIMHKNERETFSTYIYKFMGCYGCSRTQEKLMEISTDELIKDMWYLSISPDTYIYVTEIDYELFNEMLLNVNNHYDGCGIRIEELFHEYIAIQLDIDIWEGL